MKRILTLHYQILGFSRRIGGIITVIMLLFSLLLAGTTGKITGHVTDQKTGEPLIGCNIVLEGTYLGAATDQNGEYFILNVPPGEYNLKATMIGYQPVVVKNVRVNVDLTTRQDFELSSQVISGQEVVVVAQQPIVRKDITSSSARISSDELEAIPVETFDEVVQKQAGIVDGHFRGGRSGETLYMIDGMPATDPFQGNFASNVENEAIKELEVITGSFNAEYGTAMSGVVNIVTKDGSNDYQGGLNLYTGQWLTLQNENIFPHLKRFNPLSINNIQANVSGAIVKDRLFFYVTTRFYEEEGYYWGRRYFNPQDGFHKSANEQKIMVVNEISMVDSLVNLISGNAEADTTSFILTTGDSSWLPMDPYEKINIHGKLTWRVTNKITLKYNIVTENPMNFFEKSTMSPMTYQDYNHNFRYNPEGTLTRENFNFNQTLQLTHQLSSKTFYTIGINQFNTNYKEYYFKDPANPLYGVLSARLNGLPPNTYNIGGIENHHYDRNTTSNILRTDLTSQITKRHQVKTGLEVQSHHLKYRDNTFDLTTGSTQGDKLNVTPLQVALYVQDKIEFSDIIVNAGLRLDYFDPKAKMPADPTDPDIDAPLRSWLKDYSRSQLEKIWWEKVAPKVQVSPRLGLAYPITDQGVIHISYGHFFQMPNFEHLYTNPEWELGNDIGDIRTMGNPDLDAEQTISYEIGLQQQLSENLKMNADYYVRDVRGWINREKRVIARDGRIYDQYINSEFASIRGVTLELNKRFADGYSFTVDYTFQIAEGTGSDPNTGVTRLSSGQKIEKQVLPLDWDRRHTLNADVVLGQPNDWTTSILMTIGSGLPYDAVARNTPSPFVRNDGRKPVYINFDFKATKTLQLFGLRHTVYTKVNNLLDIANETNVYGDSGRSTYSRSEIIYQHSDFSRKVNTLEEYYNDPSRFSSPMRITFGYQIEI